MTFQVQVECLICRKLIDPTIILEKETNAETFNLLHSQLCLALKLEFSPKFREWDFAEEPFPYCESCGQRLQRLGELIAQLKSIEVEINGSLAAVSALVITSDQSDPQTIEPLVTPKLGQAKEYFKSRGLQEKHKYFRNLIIQRLDPRVIVERCDGNWSYPTLSNVGLQFEFVLKPTLIKTEAVIEPFPDNAAEEEILDETDNEFKVDTGSMIISGVEPILRNEISTSLSPLPALASVPDTSDKVEIPITYKPIDNVLGKRTPPLQYQARYDESSETYDFLGFKFKELANGCFKCSTCGHVSAVPQGRYRTTNIMRHISRIHIGKPRSDGARKSSKHGKESKKYDQQIHPKPRSLGHGHRIIYNPAHMFKCRQCGEKFPVKGFLKKHILLTHKEHGESRIDTSSGVEPETIRGLEETRTEAPALSLALDPVENPAKSTFTNAKDPGFVKSTPSNQIVTFDELSKTYDMSGFKFKQLEGGSYECCTCEHVSVISKGRTSKDWNIKHHIMTMHMGIPRCETRKRPRVCDECGKIFGSLSQLYTHRARMHRPPKLQCDLCEARFCLKWDLNQHVLTHDKERERPYSCEQCDKSFFTNSHLRMHSSVHASGTPEQCSRCSAKYKSRDSLRKHIRKVHGKDGLLGLAVLESGIKDDPDA